MTTLLDIVTEHTGDRLHSKKLIAEWERVRVNGKPARDPSLLIKQGDAISFNDRGWKTVRVEL